jgi:hypothetical protein
MQWNSASYFFTNMSDKLTVFQLLFLCQCLETASEDYVSPLQFHKVDSLVKETSKVNKTVCTVSELHN